MAILPLNLARVSNTLKVSVATQSLAGVQANLLEVQNELATGKRLNAPSDNPADSAIALQLHKIQERRSWYLTNVQQASTNLGEIDSTLGDMTDLLQQAQQIASANIGSDVSADQRSSAAEVVKS